MIKDRQVPRVPGCAGRPDEPLGGKCSPGDVDFESQFQCMTVY